MVAHRCLGVLALVDCVSHVGADLGWGCLGLVAVAMWMVDMGPFA